MEETEHTEPTEPHEPQHEPSKKSWRSREFFRVIIISFACLLVLIGAVTGYLYASTPVTIRKPLLEHYHFRMQILVNGKAENFADAKYQQGYSKDNCNVALPDKPIHFHDSKDQFVHIHWEGMTGGQVLKFYGWNFIGGTNGTLGYRFDELPKLVNVPIHGKTLPAIPTDAKFYVYTGDELSFTGRNFDDFTHQDLEKFFNKTSNFPAHQLNQSKRKSSFLNTLTTGLKNALEPTAYATSPINDKPMPPTMDMSHGEATANSAPHSEEDLKRINNLLGNVVIFVQKDKPTEQQIKDRFDRLEPLSDSTCAG